MCALQFFRLAFSAPLSFPLVSGNAFPIAGNDPVFISTCSLSRLSRREAFQIFAVIPASLLPIAPVHSVAPAFELELYQNRAARFSVLRPRSWSSDATVNTDAFTAYAGGGPAVAFADERNPVLNMSVLARPVVDVSAGLRAFGSPMTFGKRLVSSVAGGEGRSVRTARLIRACVRHATGSDTVNSEMYEVEYIVASTSWIRHNLCIVAVGHGLLYTLNLQAPAGQWASLEHLFRQISASFKVMETI